MPLRHRHKVGDWLYCDDESGIIRYRSQIVPKWDGFWVYKSQYESRQPQEFIKAKADPYAIDPIHRCCGCGCEASDCNCSTGVCIPRFIGNSGIPFPVTGAAAHLFDFCTNVDIELGIASTAAVGTPTINQHSTALLHQFIRLMEGISEGGIGTHGIAGVAGLPVCTAVISTQESINAATSIHTWQYPTSIVAGNLLIGCIVLDADAAQGLTFTTPSGWNLISELEDDNGRNGALYWREADGTETGSFTQSTPSPFPQPGTTIILNFDYADAGGVVSGVNFKATTHNIGGGTGPAPPTITMPATDNWLAFSIAGWASTQDLTAGASGYPANMTDIQGKVITTDPGGTSLAWAGACAGTVASFNPGDFELGAGRAWITWTLAMRYIAPLGATVTIKPPSIASTAAFGEHGISGGTFGLKVIPGIASTAAVGTPNEASDVYFTEVGGERRCGVLQETVAVSMSAVSTYTFTYPSSIQSGDFLIAAVMSDGDGFQGLTYNTPTGWSVVASAVENNAGRNGAIFYKTANGSESGSFTSIVTTTSGFERYGTTLVMRLSDVDGSSLAQAGTVTVAGSNNPLPPAISMGSTDDWLVFSIVGYDTNTLVNSWPANMQDITGVERNSLASRGPSIAWAGASETNISSFTPQTFNLGGGRNYAAWTIALPCVGGSSTEIANLGVPSLTTINSANVATIDTVNSQIRTYNFDGSAWGTNGNGLVIPGLTGSDILAYMGDPTGIADFSIVRRVALWRQTSRVLAAYDFVDDTTWQISVDYGQVAAGATNPDQLAETYNDRRDGALAGVTTSLIAFFYTNANDNEGRLEMLQVDGTNWTTVGNILNDATIDVTTSARITTLDTATAGGIRTTKIALYDQTNQELRTYTHVDSTGDWSQTGNALTVSAGNAAITAMTSAQIAFVDETNGALRVYNWDGTDWSLDENRPRTINGIGTPAVAAMTAKRVAFIDSSNKKLRAYDYSGP